MVPVREALFTLAASMSLLAQEPEVPRWPANELPRHLASEDPAEVAWASYLVQQGQVRAAVPAVRRALARLASRNELDWRLARLHLLDTLIGLGVRVPGEEVLPHAIDELRVPALILAAQSPEVNSRYFAARFAATANAPDLEWQVCGNMLASLREPGFTLSCVQSLCFSLHIKVTDKKRPSIGVG
jgi:hypothetical protein